MYEILRDWAPTLVQALGFYFGTQALRLRLDNHEVRIRALEDEAEPPSSPRVPRQLKVVP